MSRCFPNYESAWYHRNTMRKLVPEPRWCVVENNDGSFGVVCSTAYAGGKFDPSPAEQKHEERTS